MEPVKKEQGGQNWKGPVGMHEMLGWNLQNRRGLLLGSEDPCGRLDRSPVGKKVAESSLSTAQELLPAAPQTSSMLADERDPSKSSQIPPTAWALSGKTRNRLAHVYNGNSAGQEGESDLDEVKRKIREVEAAMGGSTVQEEVGIYGGIERKDLAPLLTELLKKETRLAGASSSAAAQALRRQPPPPATEREVSVAHLFFKPGAERRGIRGFLAAKSLRGHGMKGYVRRLEERGFQEVEVLIIVLAEHHAFFLELIAELRDQFGNETAYGEWASDSGFLVDQPASRFSVHKTFVVEKLPERTDCSASGLSSDPAVEGVDMRSSISGLV
uniref:Uncharacterized protein n=1 Tax=Chromera velia CCMP2878 TaxID=1169474 RepID=A0A0G4I7S3_9ALVE|eukprot:Cvel_1939.t1-p1 / transcript=Cvel_1939.t1 / gene=Cvel_1939 / organism=Chromera_velia_CCMP2878 / gene_product=hypothetical protein / transcript_product=hypothetical protein / location=Cvel_scaffold73:39916-43922(-) / protein_length=327 / sequence_SO=supercontig / SO=protein_coding / is_pseudo=false